MLEGSHAERGRSRVLGDMAELVDATDFKKLHEPFLKNQKSESSQNQGSRKISILSQVFFFLKRRKVQRLNGSYPSTKDKDRVQNLTNFENLLVL